MMLTAHPCMSYKYAFRALPTGILAALSAIDAELTFIDSPSRVEMVTWTSRLMMVIMMAVPVIVLVALIIMMMVLGRNGTWRVCAAAGHLCWLGIRRRCTAVWLVILRYLNRIL